jgi:hypothetical protein
MSLRIRNVAEPQPPDTWAARLAKLIPGEGLALYGAGTSVVPDDKPSGLWLLAGGCAILIIIVRLQATKDGQRGPQLLAVAIALVSFLLWLVALQPPNGPLDLGNNAWIPALAALLWATIVPTVYSGDKPPA